MLPMETAYWQANVGQEFSELRKITTVLGHWQRVRHNRRIDVTQLECFFGPQLFMREINLFRINCRASGTSRRIDIH